MSDIDLVVETAGGAMCGERYHVIRLGRPECLCGKFYFYAAQPVMSPAASLSDARAKAIDAALATGREGS